MQTENNQEEVQENTQVVEETQIEESQAQEVQEESQEENQEQPEFDKNDPAFLAGQEFAKSQMQNAVDKRIGKEVYRRKTMEASFANQINDVTAKFEEKFKQLTQKPLEEPVYADFDSDVKYQIAVNDYIKKQDATNTTSNTNTQPVVNKNLAIDAHLEKQFVAKETLYAQNNPSYQDARQLVGLYVKDNSDLVNLLHESGPQTVDYLGNNADLLEELSGMSPAQMGRKLAQIELQLKPQQQTVNTKKRPEPTTKVRSSTGGTKSIDNMTQAEYNAFMNDPKNFS